MSIRHTLNEIMLQRILVLDGAMGSLIQAMRPASQNSCYDVLCLEEPELIAGIHKAYLEAGADIIETCSFNSNALSLAEYGLAGEAYNISREAARLAKKAAVSFSTAEKPRFAAGSIGPTAAGASFTMDMDNPGKRVVAWDALEAAYYDNARGLMDGGADMLIIETIYDCLNAKAAIFAIRRLGDELNQDIPVILSATISEAGRLLTGQSLASFYEALLHANPLAIGINCSFGADKMKPHLKALAAFAPCPVIAYPNAGLPDKDGHYSDTPEIMASLTEEWMKEGLVNIAGGCCGSTPDHISAIACRARNYRPRLASAQAFQNAIDTGNYNEAIEIAREMAANGAESIPIRPDKAPNPAETLGNFIFLSNCYNELTNIKIIIDSANLETIEAGLKCSQGKILVRYAGHLTAARALRLEAYGAELVQF
jgi:5-methyltetrahydrofolate--homocysteine methyltransferase